MYETAKGIVTNLIHLIEEYGHVLNGARAYYTNRRYLFFHFLLLLFYCILCAAVFHIVDSYLSSSF
jgi:neutral trehalase